MTPLCRISEIPANGKHLVPLNNQEILIIKTSEQIYAINNICPHAGGKLIKGHIENGTITCIEHGLCFDLANGAIRFDQLDEDLLETIDTQNLPFGPLKIYETIIDNGVLYLSDLATHTQ